MARKPSAKPPAADRVLNLARSFAAPRALVFKLWTDRAHVLRWWGPRGYRLSHCEMDVRPGGQWRFCMRSAEGQEHWIRGEYREIAAPERLSFTYINEPDGHEMLVTLRFSERAGKTRLDFHQATFLTKRGRDSHRGGWSESFDMTEEYLAALPANLQP